MFCCSQHRLLIPFIRFLTMIAQVALKLVAPVLAIVAILLHRRQKYLRRLRGCTLPPGPRGWPFIGNLLDISEERPWLIYRDWARIYGAVIGIIINVFTDQPKPRHGS